MKGLGEWPDYTLGEIAHRGISFTLRKIEIEPTVTVLYLKEMGDAEGAPYARPLVLYRRRNPLTLESRG
jgi:hypothetical protein